MGMTAASLLSQTAHTCACQLQGWTDPHCQLAAPICPMWNRRGGAEGAPGNRGTSASSLVSSIGTLTLASPMGTLTLASSVLGARGSAASRHPAPPFTLAPAPPSPSGRGGILGGSQGTTSRGGVFHPVFFFVILVFLAQSSGKEGEGCIPLLGIFPYFFQGDAVRSSHHWQDSYLFVSA